MISKSEFECELFEIHTIEIHNNKAGCHSIRLAQKLVAFKMIFFLFV